MSDENKNEEKLFSQKEVLAMFSKSLAIKAKDLAEEAEGKDLSTLGAMSSFLTTLGVDKRNSEFNKGSIKSALKKEKLIKEIFADVDLSDMQAEDMLIHLRDKVFKKSNNNKPPKDITLEQALEVPAIKDVWTKLKSSAESKDSLQLDFDNYKKMMSLSPVAISMLKEAGADFSKNPKRYKRQIELIQESLQGLNYKFGEDGVPIVLDEDNLPKRNQETGDNMQFIDLLKSISPVDFRESKEQPKPKTTPTPDNPSGSGGDNFGFSNDRLKSLGIEDYNKAKAEGNTAKMAFIKSKVVENHSTKE